MGVESKRWQEVDALFAVALETAPEERQGLLDRLCRNDARLRAAVERLLAVDAEAATFLELPAPAIASLTGGPAAAAGARLGPYRLQRLLGRGGMGTVFLARRDDGQFERTVALKILRYGADDPETRARFRTERQILSRLEHPAIARLYDGGETPQGGPFLVMEHVQGLPLDVYCDRNRLEIDGRLELFRRLLDAVAYAHQNLLVHRDIKPSNVLVTAAGEPKLLDFGIAKQLESDGAAATTRMRPRTPGYASPEQVRGESITTASDVYALGVVLYELLCGRSPYRVAHGLDCELESAILEQEPEPPSQALERPPGPGEPDRGEIAAARRARPRELRWALRGDLDTIVLTALRKEPQRRYCSVAELAADIDRFRRALPISAHPETALYRTAKFVRRHTAGVLLAALSLTLCLALLVSLQLQRNRAQRERDKTRQALDFITDVFAQADPAQQGADKVSARDLLKIGARRASIELAGDPLVQAELMRTVGTASLGLGEAAEAAPLLQRALALYRENAPATPEMARALEDLATLRLHQTDFETAEHLLREAVALRSRLLGEESFPVAEDLNRLGTVLAERYQSADPARSREIERLHRRALAIYGRLEGPDGPGTADSLRSLAKVLRNRGELAAAEHLARKALSINLAHRGPSHVEVPLSRRMLAVVLIDKAKFDEARRELREALAVQLEILPPDHPDLTFTRNDLALVASRSGAYDEAERLLRRVLRDQIARFGPDHAHTATVLVNLAGALQGQGKLEEAAILQERALAIRLARFGERHFDVGQSLGALARLRSDQGRHAEALALARRSLQLGREILPPGHRDLAWPLRTLGLVLLEAGRPAQAQPLLRESLALLRRTQPPGFFQTARVEVLLGACLRDLGRLQEAEPLITHGRATLEAQLPDSHELVQEAREEAAALVRARRAARRGEG
jgi:serine/threonine protein kinase